MAQAHIQSYEVALFGEFFSRDLTPILARITLHSESSETLHNREVVFEPVNRDSDPILLRARKDLTDPDAGWTLFSYLAPESVRAHPEATVRPWATVRVLGDALSFACALGYVRRSQIYKKGYLFRRGMLIIQMFQQEKIDLKTQEPVPASADTLWEVEVKTAFPMQNTQETPLRLAIDASWKYRC
ncbi:hypothetical protein CPB85DRAFT_1430084 [Mucidula mucida]|nr:hypothetical protein CPB85DRAFT_1430084 [Mucidula mucida]